MCKICKGSLRLWDTALVLKKHDVKYFRCENCGFIQTEEPYWLKEAYSNVIAATDVGLLSRNYNNYHATQRMIYFLFDANAKYIDYGGGYGILTRLMRDAGYEFYHDDKLCPNLFAKGFDADLRERFELVTAYEVFEHLVDPMETISEMTRLSSNILFTTSLVPFDSPPKTSEWWYYSLSTGQHISFYTTKSLSTLAAHARCNLYSRGAFHLLTQKRINPLLFAVLSSNRTERIINPLLAKRHSLLPADYNRVAGNDPTSPAALH